MSDMIIDIHTHVFPHQGGPAGYKDDPQRYLRSQRDFLHKLWGRLVTNTPDEKFIPWPGENVDFRVGKYGKWLWTKHGKECWMQRFPVLMVEAEWPPENMLAFMDAAGVDKAVLHAGYMERNYSLELLTDCMKKFPGRFFGSSRAGTNEVPRRGVYLAPRDTSTVWQPPSLRVYRRRTG